VTLEKADEEMNPTVESKNEALASAKTFR